MYKDILKILFISLFFQSCDNRQTNDIGELIKLHKKRFFTDSSAFLTITAQARKLNADSVIIENRLRSEKLQNIQLNADGTSSYFRANYENNDSINPKLVKRLEIQYIYVRHG